MVSELDPCPHCGEREHLYPAYRLDKDGKPVQPPYAIDCLGCGYDFTPRDGMDAIAAWNRRASVPEPVQVGVKDGNVALAADAIPSWPSLKKALWEVVTFEQLNDGHYINAYDLTDKLFFAAQNTTPAQPANFEQAVEVAIRKYFLERTGFGTADSDGRVSAYYGEHWHYLSPAEIAKAALAALPMLGAGQEKGEAVAWEDATGIELHKLILNYQKEDMIAAGAVRASVLRITRSLSTSIPRPLPLP